MREQSKGVCTESEKKEKNQPGDYTIRKDPSKVGMINRVKCYGNFRSIHWRRSLELQKKMAFGGILQGLDGSLVFSSVRAPEPGSYLKIHSSPVPTNSDLVQVTQSL